MFETYAKTFEIHGDKYLLHPLTGAHLGRLYSVAMKLEKLSKDEGLDISSIDDSTIATMHELITATLMASYPGEDKLKVERFAAQNLGAFIGPVIEVNFGRPKE